MGCATSRVKNEEIVARCKARRRYMKEAVSSRHQFAAAHGCYLQALRNTGAALRQFAEGEAIDIGGAATRQQSLHHYAASTANSYSTQTCLTLPSPPPPPPEMSPYRATPSYATTPPPPPPDESPYAGGAVTSPHHWSTSSQHSNAAPPPPPPPPLQASAWDFWDPFLPVSPRRSIAMEEQQRKQTEWAAAAAAAAADQAQHHAQQNVKVQEWEDTTTITTLTTATEMEYERERGHYHGVHENAIDNTSMVSSWYTKDDSDMAMVVSRMMPKDIAAVVRDLDEYFLKASTAGKEVSGLLETSKAHFQTSIGEPTKNFEHPTKLFSALNWSWPSKSPHVARRDSVDLNNDDCGRQGSHCSTLERLYAWEKKLYEEVRLGESTKIEHDKKVALLRKLEIKGEDELKIEKTKADVKRLQSQIMVAFQAVDTTSAAILKLRENELYPQLVELSKGLMHMWRTMYECHQVQDHIVQQVKHLDNPASTEPTSDYHRHATIQLEAQVTAWYDSFCRLVKSHRDYMRAINGWLRLSLNQFKNEFEGIMENHQLLYALCEEWQLALERLPDQSVYGGIRSFMTVVHGIVVQQEEELKQGKKSESLSKELEKKLISLRNLESKYYNPYGTPDGRGTDSLVLKKAKIEALKRRVEEEKSKHLKSIRVSREMTLNNLQTGLPSVFQAMTGFSSVCMQAFETVYNQAKNFNPNPCIKRLT
ncbi:hypothetical protein SUGI_0468690 [Cryptomeria japonica]|uniref:protein ALTERED PHOSPHATE STARVATION RESPONSE 1 n=1 Tax=Cryptomeria japonica TaxID=3369 RepID=UPI0024089DB5|nr:protein ALTERED PHOSPHATE STARVATION RESPONSE 1 [Cryptomeria japonica]GLJ24529.1 hypothetical protein SUGI_0468690 [Cryptomeria japonica]